MNLLLIYLRPHICVSLSLLSAGTTLVESFLMPAPAPSFSSSGLRVAVEDPEAKLHRHRARGRSASFLCGLHGALPGADLRPRLVAREAVAAGRAAAHRTRRAAQMLIAAGSAPGGRRGGRRRRSARRDGSRETCGPGRSEALGTGLHMSQLGDGYDPRAHTCLAAFVRLW